MSLLPSSYDSSHAEDGDPRVVGVESEEADEIFAALSSGTARQLLAELHDDPGPPAELADRVDTSVQNVQYHIDKLETAGAIEVVDTAYSEKGREMSVYAPADQPLVIFAGEEDEQSSLRTALSRFLGSLGILALASAVVQAVFGEQLLPFVDGGAPTEGGEDAGGDDAGGGDDAAGGDESDVNGGDAPDGDGTADGDGGTERDAPTEETEDAPEGDGAADSEEMADPDADGVDTVADNESLDTVADGVEMTDPEGVSTAAETAANLPPGLLFFAGGVFIICVVALYFHYQ